MRAHRLGQRRHLHRAILAALSMLVCVHSARADEPSAALETVLVVGDTKAQDQDDERAGSVDVITRSELEYESVDDTSELFSRVPGLYIARYNQGIINSDLAIRGFAGDGETPHAKLIIDEVPANLHNGFGELDQLIPIAIETIEVFKSTSDPRYGLFNIAGNYELRTREDAAQQAQLNYGSFNARELQTYIGLDTGAISHSYFAGYRESEGWRDHTDLEKSVFGGRWSLPLSDRTRISLAVRGSEYEADSPGYLSRIEARTNPRSSAPYANQDGGDKTLTHADFGISHQVSDAWDMALTVYGQSFERERWVRFNQASALQNRFDDQEHTGWIARSKFRFDEHWSLQAGLDGERQNVVEQRFGTLGQQRVRNTQNVLRNRHFDFDSDGAFVNLHHDTNSQWRWNVGVRLDRLSGDYRQFAANGTRSDRDMLDFGTIVQPKFNLFYAPNESWLMFANAGRSFQHPLSADLYTSGDRRARDVSRNDGGEIGVRWRDRDGRLDLRASAWLQDASNEYVVVDGTASNVGKTRRQGMDLGANFYATEQVYWFVNLSRIDTEIVRPASSQAGFVGNELRGIPGLTGSLGVNYDFHPQFTLRLHADGQSDYFVNEANVGGKFGDFALLHAQLEWRATDTDTFSLQLNNLFDQRYEYVFDLNGDGSGTIHSPGDGFHAGVSWRHQF